MREDSKAMHEQVHAAQAAMDGLLDYIPYYEDSRSANANEEARFNEGRYGRYILDAIDAAQLALTRLRTRVAINDEARSRRKDRLLADALGLDDDFFKEHGGGDDDESEVEEAPH